MGYYQVKEIYHKTYLIFDPLGVGVTLIVGNKKGLLIDTGYGFMDLRPVIKRLCPLPIDVANTHGHFDHIGGNSQFEKAYLSEKDFPIITQSLSKEYLEEITQYIKKEYLLSRFLFLLYKLQKFNKHDTQYIPLKENMSFDLGGRTIETMPFPGHSKGSVLFMDAQNQTIFVGDAINQGMFFFTNPDCKVKEYITQVEAFTHIQGYQRLYISHSVDPLPFTYLPVFADYLRRIDIKKCVAHDYPTQKEEVYEYTEKETEWGSPISAFLNIRNF